MFDQKRCKLQTNSFCLQRSGLNILMSSASSVQAANVSNQMLANCWVGCLAFLLFLLLVGCLNAYDRKQFTILTEAQTQSKLDTLEALLIKKLQPRHCKQKKSSAVCTFLVTFILTHTCTHLAKTSHSNSHSFCHLSTPTLAPIPIQQWDVFTIRFYRRGIPFPGSHCHGEKCQSFCGKLAYVTIERVLTKIKKKKKMAQANTRLSSLELSLEEPRSPSSRTIM